VAAGGAGKIGGWEMRLQTQIDHACFIIRWAMKYKIELLPEAYAVLAELLNAERKRRS
jgi:hypothetical protein